MERHNKLAVIVPFYKRHEITKLCFDRLIRQCGRVGVDLIVAGSEGKESEKVAKGKYIETPNKPLGHKLNLLLEECRDYDGIIVLGSDNFMSDSILKMYKEIDCSKEVYYSFNDILIYSAKHGKIVSDFDYTRAGNGIGVARLYTKPTLEKMKYKVWDGKRLKGLDKSASDRCKRNGIEHIILDLGEHFLLDAKIEENISAHEIIFSGHKEHPLDTLKVLGKTGEKILKMKVGKERVYNKYELRGEEPIEKVKAKILVGFNDHKRGDIVEFKKHIFTRLRRGGYVSHAS